MSVTIKYKNNDILNIPLSGDYHLNTQGKYLEDDIRIIAEAPEDGDLLEYGLSVIGTAIIGSSVIVGE